MAQRRWQDWLNLILGAWLFVSPWALGTSGASSTNAWWLGALIVIVSAWALSRPEELAPEWTNVVLGVWTFLAPFILFPYAAAWNAWLVGFVVAVVAGTEIAMIRQKITHA